jgi:hypothetical protein
LGAVKKCNGLEEYPFDFCSRYSKKEKLKLRFSDSEEDRNLSEQATRLLIVKYMQQEVGFLFRLTKPTGTKGKSLKREEAFHEPPDNSPVLNTQRERGGLVHTEEKFGHHFFISAIYQKCSF